MQSRYHGKHMRNDKKRALWRAFQIFASSFMAVALIGIFIYVTQGREIPVLNPQGLIADQQYTLILITVGLGFFVVVPVFILLFSIAWKYRAGNKKAKYEPEMEGHRGLELLWWGIPCVIILLLAIITHISTHALDPYKALESDKTPVKVQVIALEWNWLFIYPEYGTATLNFMNIPEDTPVNLTLTSDAPMNSFWVPALAGQVYAMSGMSTKLHLMADSVGTYNGTTANISGEGYADMRFKVYSMTEADFQTWVKRAANSADGLTTEKYEEIAQPNKDRPETTYRLITSSIFDDVIMKYMSEKSHTEGSRETHEGMSM
jgi:cytochrome o ubiquinol oxidase subunit 2